MNDWTPLLTNVVCAILTLVIADAALLSRRFGAQPLARTAALLAIVVAFPLPGMVLLGMEHILHLLLTVTFAALAVLSLAGPPVAAPLERRRTIALCASAALLAASRYSDSS